MKTRILGIIAIIFLCGLSAFSQAPVTGIYLPANVTSYGTHAARVKPDSALMIPTSPAMPTTLQTSYQGMSLIRYDSTNAILWIFNPKSSVMAWDSIHIGAITGGGSSGWNLDGNTVGSIKGLGTLDDYDLKFLRNNVESGRIGFNNVSLGRSALENNVSGIDNSAFGTLALRSNTTGSNNTALGVVALWSNEDGGQNTAIGLYSMLDNVSGNDNTAIGSTSLTQGTGSRNTAIGTAALYPNQGNNNIGIGYYSGRYSNSSNELLINSLDRVNRNGDTTLSGFYAVQATAAADQRLRINFGRVTMPYLPTTSQARIAMFDASGNIYSVDSSTVFNTKWSVRGNAASSGDYAGTNNTQDYIIKTNSAEIARFTGDGLYKISMGNSAVASGSNSVAIGTVVTASGTASTAFGASTTATAGYSTAWGNGADATGDMSTAGGNNSIASGTGSVAIGTEPVASGLNSSAWNFQTRASGSASTAFGDNTKSKSYGGYVIGTYNDSTNAADAATYNALNRAFQIGNGTSDAARSNAMTVLFNGNVGIGSNTPAHPLQVGAGTFSSNYLLGAGIGVYGTGAFTTINIQNPTTTSSTGFAFGESNSEIALFIKNNSAVAGTVSGSGVPNASATYFQSGGGYDKPMYFFGTPIVNQVGTTSTNIGTKLTAGGLYISPLSSINGTSATAKLHIAAGAAGANTAPLKFTNGVINTGTEPGAMEYQSPQLLFTNESAIRQEIPLIQQTRITTQVDNGDNSLTDLSELIATVKGGRTYRFEAKLYTTSDAGQGVQAAIGGTAVETNIVYEGLTTDAGLITQSRGVAIGEAVGAVTAVTSAYMIITGTITVDADGTLTVQFAANVSGITPSSVLVGSTFVVTEIL